MFICITLSKGLNSCDIIYSAIPSRIWSRLCLTTESHYLPFRYSTLGSNFRIISSITTATLSCQRSLDHCTRRNILAFSFTLRKITPEHSYNLWYPFKKFDNGNHYTPKACIYFETSASIAKYVFFFTEPCFNIKIIFPDKWIAHY